MWKQNDQKNYKKWWNFSGLKQKLSSFIGEKVLPLSLEQEHFSLDQKNWSKRIKNENIIGKIVSENKLTGYLKITICQTLTQVWAQNIENCVSFIVSKKLN